MDICCRSYYFKFYFNTQKKYAPFYNLTSPHTTFSDIKKTFSILHKTSCPFSIPFAAEFPLRHENKETKHPIVCDAYKLLQSNVPQVFCMQDRVRIKSL